MGSIGITNTLGALNAAAIFSVSPTTDKTQTRSYKKNSDVEFQATLELTNQISHVTILVSLIGQFQHRVKLFGNQTLFFEFFVN